MSHLVYDGVVTVENLGTEFNTSANPIVLKLDPSIEKLPSGALKANVSGVVTGTNLALNGGAPINLLPAIKAGETVTVMAYDSAAKKITYTNEAGTLVTIDLSSIAADIYTTVGNYDAATMTITLVDNDGATPDIAINLAELKKVATSNSSSVSFTGTGEASSPLIATVTSIPAGVTLSPSQISPGTFPAGVITPAANIGPGPLPTATTIAPSQITAGALPANVTVPGGNITGVIDPTVMTASTTNTLAVTGPNLVSTVNGVEASVPMASIVPATIHVNTWTKATGLKEDVNGVASDVAIVAGTIVDMLGYNAAGEPVHQVVGNQPDFFSSVVATADTLGSPNGTTDRTESIRRDGNIGINVSPLTDLDVKGSFSTNITLTGTTGDYTVVDTDSTINVISTSWNSTATRNIAIPAATAWPRRILTIKATADAFGETINVVSAGGNVESSTGSIATSQSFNARAIRSRTYQSDGFNWQLIGQVETDVSRYTPLYTGPTVTAQMPPETQVWNMSDGAYVSPVILPPITSQTEPLTILSRATFDFTVAPTNQIAGATAQAGTKDIPMVYYPTSDGWVYGGVPGADFFRSTAGNLTPDGKNDLTEKIYHTGSIGIGQVDPKTKLHITGSGTSAVVPAAGSGMIISDGTSPRIYFENTGATTGARVMLLESTGGLTKFGSLSDNAGAFVKSDILTMNHTTGDLVFSGYPNTRNDPGAPVNVLTTTASGAVQSHPIKELTPQAYAYKNPNPITGTVTNRAQLPAANVVGNAVTIPDGITTFRTSDGDHALTIQLLPSTPTSVPIVVWGDALSPVYVLPDNTDMEPSLFLPKGTVARFVPGVDGQWHWVAPEINPPTPTIVKNTVTSPVGNFTVPSQVIAGATTTYTNLVLIPQANPSPITIPATANYPKNEPLYLKTIGAWTGSIVITPAGGQVDGAASYTFAKASATLKPSITVMHDGSNWYVV